MHRFKLLILAVFVLVTAILPGVADGAGAGVVVPPPPGSRGETWLLCIAPHITIWAKPGKTTYGTNGDDIILGTAGKDKIYGRGGNDIICGLAGDDKLYGGPGNDDLWGSYGSDKLRGDSGLDVCGVNWGRHDKPRLTGIVVATGGDHDDHDKSCEITWGSPRGNG